MRKLIALLAVCFVMGAFASAAMAVTVEVDEVSGSSSGVDVPITVSDPTNIAGAAFTLEYDTDAIEITEVSSTFFDTFVNQGFTQADGLDANNMVDGYASPLVENYITGSGMKISAARKDGASSGSATTLFTLRVRLKNGSEGVAYPIEIVKTELSNTSAGYSASGEEIPVLYDVDAGGNIGAMAGTVLESGSYGTNIYLNGDFDGNGDVDIWDAVKTYQLYMGELSQDQMHGDCDVDQDGDIDIWDAVKIYNCYMGDDTCN